MCSRVAFLCAFAVVAAAQVDLNEIKGDPVADAAAKIDEEDGHKPSHDSSITSSETTSLKDLEDPPVDYKAAAAEFVAMTLFVIIGCGSAMSIAKDSSWVLQVSLTFGLAITSLAYAVGHYSGGQINCAVTWGLVVAGKITMGQGMANFVAQMLGSVFGAVILRCMYPEEKDKTGGLATNGISEGWTPMNAFLGEACMTFLLMYVVMETAVNPAAKANAEVACLAIGFAVFLAHSVLISVDGCSINPTRTFGPALVRKLTYKNGAGAFSDMWVFWAGPLVGATLAAFTSNIMIREYYYNLYEAQEAAAGGWKQLAAQAAHGSI